MSRLNDLQAGIRRAVLSGDTTRVAGAIRGDGLAPSARLRIYRNHYLITLGDALAATFPVVARLVGERCFAGLAREFIALSPPSRPCLFEYGAGFALYLAAVPTLDGLPYLPDVARLEWAINEARHAPDAPGLEVAALARLPDASFPSLLFTFHPASRLIASPYPIDRIWRLNQPDADPHARVSLDEGGASLLVHRDADDDVGWRRLSRDEFVFLGALRAGRTLGEAWSRAGAGFNGGRALTASIEAGILIDFTLRSTETSR